MERPRRYRTEIERDLEQAQQYENDNPDNLEKAIAWKLGIMAEIMLDVCEEIRNIKRKIDR